MNHIATLSTEFIKYAFAPDWWTKLSIKEQKEYIRNHPHTSLYLVYPKKEINGLTVGKVDSRNAIDSSFVGYIKNLQQSDVIKTFGTPNANTKKYGNEWIVRVGPRIVTLYGHENGTWHLGAHTSKDDVAPFLKKIFSQIEFTD